MKINQTITMSQEVEHHRVESKLISLSCPTCSDELFLEGYVRLSTVLKPRYWHSCRTCGFSRDVYDFKKELLTV